MPPFDGSCAHAVEDTVTSGKFLTFTEVIYIVVSIEQFGDICCFLFINLCLFLLCKHCLKALKIHLEAAVSKHKVKFNWPW